MKTGDKVSDKNKGRVFIVKSEPWDFYGARMTKNLVKTNAGAATRQEKGTL